MYMYVMYECMYVCVHMYNNYIFIILHDMCVWYTHFHMTYYMCMSCMYMYECHECMYVMYVCHVCINMYVMYVMYDMYNYA